MTPLLGLTILTLGVVLCAVLAEPWQRPRYDQWADAARRKWEELGQNFDEFDALAARDLHSEANGE